MLVSLCVTLFEVKMSELKFSINSRKYVRKLVTECHNRKSSFSTLSETEKSKVKSELQDHLELLKKHNANIQNLKWQEEEDEAWLKNELENWEAYFGKIRECLVEQEPHSLSSHCYQEL